MEVEPLNPLHRYRLALSFMRFGLWKEALQVLDSLIKELPATIFLPQYLRGLCYLKNGLEKRANNIANEVLLSHPGNIPAKFLGADALIRQRFQSVAKSFTQLPKGLEYEGFWADLLLKTILLYPQEGIPFVEKFLKEQKIILQGEKAIELVRLVIQFHKYTLVDIVEYLHNIPAGSKKEQIALLCFYNASVSTLGNDELLVQLNQMHKALPERSSVRKLLVTFTTRLLAKEAGNSNFEKALSLNERCMRLEPFDPIHYQNRATLFTLMRESEGYHQSWENLDRLEYRLLLLGFTDEKRMRSIARRHRMFAQQARLSARPSAGAVGVHMGIFREDLIKNKEDEWRLSVNQTLITDDPEQLRQWIFHRQAEMVFAHLAMGEQPRRFLLGFYNEASTNGKLAGLVKMTDALPVLIAGEGEKLQDLIKEFWEKQYAGFSPDYSPPNEEDELISFLQENHLDTLGDLTMLCLSWEPKAEHEFIVWELLAFLEASTPFLNAALLFKTQELTATPWLWLRHTILEQLNLQEPPQSLGKWQQKKVADHLAASLLVNLSWEKFRVDSSPGGIVRAIKLLDKARKLDPSLLQTEYFSAFFYYQGSFLQEAKEAIQRFYKVLKDKDSSWIKRIEEIQQLINKAEPGQSKQFFKPDNVNDVPFLTTDMHTEQVLREAIEQMPASFDAYEKLALLLSSSARWAEAILVSEQAVTRCLTRVSQLKARMLNIEILALQLLSGNVQEEIHLYTKGVPAKLQQYIMQQPQAEIPYELLYLAGKIYLTEGEVNLAKEYFEQSLKNCSRQLHFGVLKNLVQNIERIIIELAQQIAQQAVRDQDFTKGVSFLLKVIPHLQDPRMLLLDIAEIQVSVIIMNYQIDLPGPLLPSFSVKADWNEQLQYIINQSSGLKQVRGFIGLANKLAPEFGKKGNQLLEKLNQLEDNLLTVKALDSSNKLLKEGKYLEALAALDLPDLYAAPGFAILRQKAFLLLKLERLKEADELAAIITNSDEPAAKQFGERFELLRIKIQIQITQQYLRKGDYQSALKILQTFQPQTQEDVLETVYCKALAYFLEAYDKIKMGNRIEAIALFQKSQNEIEDHIQAARSSKHTRLLELYDKTSKEIENNEAAKAQT